jgi:hypothetical protein
LTFTMLATTPVVGRIIVTVVGGHVELLRGPAPGPLRFEEHRAQRSLGAEKRIASS